EVDECALGTDRCSTNALCTDISGGYRCTCNAGYIGDGFTCLDYNECLQGEFDCSPLGYCLNVPGSYTCKCQIGYLGDGVTCESKEFIIFYISLFIFSFRLTSSLPSEFVRLSKKIRMCFCLTISPR
ncbi:unnamed protein product, partial [Owenia fusiformis]